MKGEELSTFVQARFDPSEPPRASFTLTVVSGPGKGRSLAIDGAEPTAVLVGSSEACALQLEDREVSRRHAALEIEGATLRITDLASTNGTFVGSLRVGVAFLRGGELLRFGTTDVAVEQRGASAAPLTTATSFGRVLGASREMRRIYPLCERLAVSNVPIVIEGETGTGKEALAESLHERSPRARAPFVVFDCTAVTPSLVEAELFGHERGAFTGAVKQRLGVFEQADGGTLFIDELGELDVTLQPKLLRALERSEIRRVGGDAWIKVDVRIIAATRRDLDAEVEAGRFRDDLYHRLAVGRIALPPLRARKGDIGPLARALSVRLGAAEDAIPAARIAQWERQPWPGNVRELRNAVARELALGDMAALESAKDDPGRDVIERVIGEGLPLARARARVVEAFERRYVEAMLGAHGGNVSRAAHAAGVARRYFQILRARRS
ncbi:MAG TPA: sigma 54-interacting transcriptional regulator [Polyangiaceae bacterium]|jgi:DNA-binding NtrC family response regulator